MDGDNIHRGYEAICVFKNGLSRSHDGIQNEGDTQHEK